jgi:PKD repeat protein
MKKIVLLLLVFLFNLCVFSQKIDFQIESGGDSYCKYSKVKFKNTSTYSLNDCNYYKWVFGNGDTLVTNSIDTPVEYSYNQHGSFKPVLLGYKKEGNNLLYVGQSYNYYSVNLPSPVTFSTSSEAYCPGETVNFNYSNYSTLTTTPKWDFGNGRSQYSTYGASTIYIEPGEYTVKLIYEHNYCDNTTIKDTLSQIVKISSFVQPKPEFNIPEKVCPGEPISLYSNNQAIQYEWDMGDKNVYYSNSATHKYKESWKFDVTLTLTNACGNKKSVTKQIEVTKTARTNFGKYFYSSWEPYSDKVVCLNEPVKFDFYNSDNYQSISWNFGDQTILSNVNKGEHIYTSAKDFVLQLKLVDFCNNDTILKRNISVKNSVPFGQNLLSAEVNLCPGETHYFSSYSNSYGNDKNIKSFQWILPNNQFFSNSFSKSFNTNTNIQLKLQDYCGRDTIYNQQIKIVNDKTFDNLYLEIGTLNHSTSGDITICPNQQFNVRSYSDDVKTISCDYGNGVYGKNIPYSFSQFGSYPIKIKGTNFCGNETVITKIINVQPIQINNAFIQSRLNNNSSKVCVGDMLILDAEQDYSYGGNSSVKYYEWDFGDGTKGYGNSVNHIYSNIGLYNVKLKLTNSCGDTLTVFRTFEVGNNNVPVIFDNDFINIIDRLCPNESFDFKIFGRYKDVVWNFGDNTSAEKGNFVSHKFSTPGSYNVTVNLTNQCGNINSYTEKLEVRADIQPDGDFDFFENEICPGENMVLILEKENPNDQFTFDFGDNSTNYKKEMDLNFYSDEEQLTIISHKYQSVGEKLVTVNVKNACGNTASYQEIVSVRSDLKIKDGLYGLDIGNEFYLGDTSLLFIESHGKSFEWNLGDNVKVTTDVPILKYIFASNGLKTISVKVTTGCGDVETFTEELFVTTGNKISLSTEKISSALSLNIYPNPSTGIYNFSVSEQMLGKKYTISDIMGRVVIDAIVNDINQEVHLENFSGGTYILNFDSSDSIKLIKY